MKKLSKNIEINLKMPKIFRDDIKEIEDILSSEPDLENYKINLDNVEYDNVNEIPVEHLSVNKMYIRAYRPDVNITFTSVYATISSRDENETRALGIATRVYNILKRRERKLAWIIGETTPILLLPFVILVIKSLISLKKSWISAESIIYTIILLAVTIVIFFGIKNKFFSYSIVNFKRRTEMPGWLSRNKDQMIIQVISSTLGAIVGGIIGYIIGSPKA